MTVRITMQEGHMDGDTLRVRTRVGPDLLTEELMAQMARAWKLSAGQRIVAQCMNHERTAVFAEAEFVVVSAVTGMYRIEKDDLTEQQVERTEYKVARKGEPWIPGKPEAEESEQAAKRGPGRPPKQQAA